MFSRKQVFEKIYPENMTCRLCGRDVFDGGYFCDDCRAVLPYNDGYCPRCGRSVGHKVRGGLCDECKKRAPAFRKARSLFDYRDEARFLVQALKSRERETGMAEAFAAECLPILKREFADAELIAFVPVAEDALAQRGYNQAEIFARELGAQSGLPVAELFTRVRGGTEQKTLDEKARRENLKGNFRLVDRTTVRGKNVLLVDDVMTTGATAETLAGLLSGAKAARVYVLTVASVARGRKKDGKVRFLSNHHKKNL